ncbi:MAG: hypothetical protein JWR69_616 [Pedosphaera sp.]|nr:hypothetical protein [Pedosphaera sp.]
MKIKSLKSIIGTTVALAMVVGAWSPLYLQAADQIKGASKLLSSATTTASQTTPSADKIGMSCPKCKTVGVQNVNVEKGHIKTVTTGEKHLCPACDTKLVIKGTGKGATTALVHTCAMGGNASANCCDK